MAPHVRKSDTNHRQAIPVPCWVAACIYKLVTGCRSADLMSKFGIGRSTLCSILRQVIPGIIEVLGGCSIRWPRGGQAFQATSLGIQEICSLPNCGGILGACKPECNIPIAAPTEDSVVLQVTCDHERKFTSVHVGKAGSMDYGIRECSDLRHFSIKLSLVRYSLRILRSPCPADQSWPPISSVIRGIRVWIGC